MAIIFNKTIESEKLCLAYNNNILDFTTNNPLDVVNCQVSINGTLITLYPHPNKRFYLNLKQYITSFLNVDNFTDDLDFDMFITEYYDWTDKIFLNTDIDIQINFIDLSSETTSITANFLSGYLQLNTRDVLQIDDVYALTPQKNKNSLLRIWNGYPFDFTIYRGSELNTLNFFFNEEFEIASLENYYLISRYFWSDGQNNALLISADYNFDLIIKSNAVKKFTYHIIQTTPKCDKGFYIKWINSLGGYSYWLFENWDSNVSTKDLGEINNDYNNLEDTLSKSIQIGKTSQKRVNVTTDVINEEEQLLLSDLFDSPKIYWFIGTPNEVNNFKDWTEISLVTSSIPTEKTKRTTNNFNLTFELPTNDTRTI